MCGENRADRQSSVNAKGRDKQERYSRFYFLPVSHRQSLFAHELSLVPFHVMLKRCSAYSGAPSGGIFSASFFGRGIGGLSWVQLGRQKAEK